MFVLAWFFLSVPDESGGELVVKKEPDIPPAASLCLVALGRFILSLTVAIENKRVLCMFFKEQLGDSLGSFAT